MLNSVINYIMSSPKSSPPKTTSKDKLNLKTNFLKFDSVRSNLRSESESFVPKLQHLNQKLVKDSMMDSRYPPHYQFSYEIPQTNDMMIGQQYSNFDDIKSTYEQHPPKMVWNTVRNVYEYLPLMQHSASFPLMSDTYDMLPETSYQQQDYPQFSNKYEPLQQQQQQQQQANYALGNLWYAACNFAENFIVQMVCDQTKPKICAETLAKSKLNPNAKEFMPKLHLNKNIHEAINNGIILNQASESMEKSDEERKYFYPTNGASPTIGIPNISEVRQTEGSPSPVSPKVTSPNSICGNIEEHGPLLISVLNQKATPLRRSPKQNFIDEDNTSNYNQERLNASWTSGTSSFTENGSVDSFFETRIKCISECSDDFHIEFDEDYNADYDNTEEDRNTTEGLEDEESELSSEDDDDWDEEGDYDSAGGSGICVELNEDESKELMLPSFSSPLFQLNPSSATSVEGYPSHIKPCSSLLDDANRRWMDQFQSASFIITDCEPKAVIILSPLLRNPRARRKGKSVCWKEEKYWEVIAEPAEFKNDLKEARISDYERRKANKERLERILAPVFTSVHREKVFERLYGSRFELAFED